MAIALVIYALKYLIRNNKYDWIKYLVFNLIAISFHTYAAVCLIFLLLNKIDRKKLYKVCFVLTLIESIIVINKNILINILSLFMKKQKVEAYFISSAMTPRDIYCFKINNYFCTDDFNC